MSNTFLGVTNVRPIYCCSEHLFVLFRLRQRTSGLFPKYLSHWWFFTCSSDWIRFSLSEPWISDRVLQVQGDFLYETEATWQIRTAACSGTQTLHNGRSQSRGGYFPVWGGQLLLTAWQGGLGFYWQCLLFVSTMCVTNRVCKGACLCTHLTPENTTRTPRHTLSSPSVAGGKILTIQWSFKIHCVNLAQLIYISISLAIYPSVREHSKRKQNLGYTRWLQ